MAGKRATRHDPTSHLRAASALWGGTSYKNAPTKSVSVGGTRFVYRELGIDSGVPVIFVNHLAANLDNWDPRVVDGIAAKHRVITFDFGSLCRARDRSAWPASSTSSSCPPSAEMGYFSSR